MKKKNILIILFLLSGCQKLSTSVPGRTSTSSSVHYKSPYVPTNNNSSSSGSISSSSKSTSSIADNTQSSSKPNNTYVSGDILIKDYYDLYTLSKEIEIVDTITNEELNNEINDIKSFHQESKVYRYHETFIRKDSKIISIESNTNVNKELLALKIRIENQDGSYQNEDAYISDGKYYGYNRNSAGEETRESNELSQIGTFDFIVQNLNAYYSNNMLNPFKDIDADNMNYGYDINNNLIIQNSNYRIVVAKEKYIFKILDSDMFIIEYNVANFEFPDFSLYN